jgi:hypothetical protein
LSRRVSLPAADDLFRPTTNPGPEPGTDTAPGSRTRPEAGTREGEAVDADGEADEPAAAGETRAGRARRGRSPSGRVRHDEKMTVYVTADELLDLEHARLLLRRDHGLAVDRGRIVREAVALALADLDVRGEDSVIVQRLKQA